MMGEMRGMTTLCWWGVGQTVPMRITILTFRHPWFLALYGTACGQRCQERWRSFNVTKSQDAERFVQGEMFEQMLYTHDCQSSIIGHLTIVRGGVRAAITVIDHLILLWAVVDHWRDALSLLSLSDRLALRLAFLGDYVLRGAGSLCCKGEIYERIRERGRVGRDARHVVEGSVTKMIGFSGRCGRA